MHTKIKHKIWMMVAAVAVSNMAIANETILLSSDTGDNLMLHKLHSDELWASFQITDQVVESFALQELIVLQVDDNKPVKLQQGKKVCGAPKSKDKQTIDYVFKSSDTEKTWAFGQTKIARSNVLKTLGWDDDTYDTLPSDRRSEFVDFPLEPIISGTPNLWQQFELGEKVVFRYVTEAGETRQAKFELADFHTNMAQLKKSHLHGRECGDAIKLSTC